MRTANVAPALPAHYVDTSITNYHTVRSRIQAMLHGADDEDCDTLRLTADAALVAMRLLDEAYPLVQGHFPLGAAVIDEGGGVNVYWLDTERRVELAFPIGVGDPGFIYHQEGRDFAIDRDISPHNLATWLRWFARV